MRKNTTINDIAKEVGVSKATVSRVLNNSKSVDDKTRQKVQEIVKKRHYVPSATARNLSRQASSTVGVIIPDVANTFFGELLRGVIEIVDQNDLTLICCSTDDIADKDFKALNLMKTQRVSGLIYDPAVEYSKPEDKKKVIKKLEELGAPIVVVDRNIGLHHDAIYFDDYHAIYESVETLIEKGHRKIAILNGKKDLSLTKSRQQGYIDAMHDYDISIDESYVYYGDYGMTKAYETTKIMMKREEQPTAVVTCNNMISQGFLKAVYEGGKKIPDDYAHIGLDKLDMLDILGIPYNYIKRDSYLMGKKATELLMKRLKDPEREIQQMVLDTPVIRQTI